MKRAAILLSLGLLANCGESSSSDGTVGQTGSTAKFAIALGHLYVLAQGAVFVYQLEDPRTPVPVTSVDVAWDAETIFANKGRLYFGAASGMHIFDLQKDPTRPQPLGSLQHEISCDPVVVQDHLAYVTLRSNGNCRGNVNQLEIIDIGNPTAPKRLAIVPLTAPWGLAVSANRLFICDGYSGLKMFDIQKPLEPKLLTQEPNEVCHDVIARDGLLVVTGTYGIAQYEYANATLQKVSEL